jgi:cytochrome b involved in lipid metabolism
MAIQRIDDRRTRNDGSVQNLEVYDVVDDSTFDGSRSKKNNMKSSLDRCFPCGACRCCEGDTCGEPVCEDCVATTVQQSEHIFKSVCPISSSEKCFDCQRQNRSSYTMCEIRRHNTTESAWIVAGNDIYDVTEYMNIHPGGSTSLLKKSGGVVDCSRDLHFHSKKGQKLWQKYYIGKVVACPYSSTLSSSQKEIKTTTRFVEKEWWKFWE